MIEGIKNLSWISYAWYQKSFCSRKAKIVTFNTWGEAELLFSFTSEATLALSFFFDSCDGEQIKPSWANPQTCCHSDSLRRKYCCRHPLLSLATTQTTLYDVGCLHMLLSFRVSLSTWKTSICFIGLISKAKKLSLHRIGSCPSSYSRCHEKSGFLHEYSHRILQCLLLL